MDAELVQIKEGGDIVQFACPTYVCEEKEQVVEIDVMRMGSLKGLATVKYETLNNSGKAGDRYEARQGLITFGEGEANAVIQIRILSRRDWCPTLEFKVELSEPENCTLGYYLNTTKVRVMDNDVFPTDKYRSQITKSMQGARDAPEWGLMREFVTMIFKQRGLRWRTCMILCGDQLQNAYAGLKFTMVAYLVNIVLNFHDESTRDKLLIINQNRFFNAAFVASGYIIPMLFLHLWDYWKIRIDITGHVRVFLSTCLFRSFLTYSAESRSSVDTAEIQRGLIQETADLATGYEVVLNCSQMLGKLAVMIGFVWFKQPSALWIVCAMPLLIFLYAAIRGNRVQIERQRHDRTERTVLNVIRQTCEKYDIIHCFQRRSAREEMYRRKAHETRESLQPLLIIMNNNLYITKWLGPLFIGLYIIMCSPIVLLDKLELGYFLSVISILDSMSSLFEEFYRSYQKMEEIFEPLLTLTTYFNMATDLKQQKIAMDENMRWMKVMKESAQAGNYDSIPIVFDHVSFRFKDHPILQNAGMTVRQGGLVTITGNPGTGRCTILKLLASVLLPQQGNVHVPPHLRKLFVPLEPVILLDMTLWENLTLGCTQDTDPSLVQTVLEEMGMTKVLKALEYFDRMFGLDQDRGTTRYDTEFDDVDGTDSATTSLLHSGKAFVNHAREKLRSGVQRIYTSPGSRHAADMQRREQDDIVQARKKELGAWFEKLNYTEKAKIHLARAFIMNPEIMVMHRPLLHYSRESGKQIVSHMVSHVKNRGMGHSTAMLSFRRPRTIFCSTDEGDEALESISDSHWLVDGKTKALVEMSSTSQPFDYFQRGMNGGVAQRGLHMADFQSGPSQRGLNAIAPSPGSLDQPQQGNVAVGVAMGLDDDLLGGS